MGKITITVEGSFPDVGTSVNSALDGGHAVAVSRAISVLNNLLPGAIALDHQLHDNGDRPPIEDFGGKDPYKVVFGSGGR